MIYFWLILAIITEAGWAIAMKKSNGLTQVGPTIATIVMYLLSVVFLAQVTKRMDVGVAYAMWAGAGAALIAIAGLTYFREPVNAIKIVSILLIIAGIVGLQLSGSSHGAAGSQPISTP